MGQIERPRGYFRRLATADRSLFGEHLLRLDRASRYDRFGGFASDAFLAEYAGRALDLNGVAFGYVEDGVLRAAAELRLASSPARPEGEAAFSVEQGWRRRGVASGLFRRIIDLARARGVARIEVACLPHNNAMQALARKFDGELVRHAPDTLGVIEMPGQPAPTPWRDAAADAAAFAAALLDSGPGLAPLAAPRQRDSVSGAPERDKAPFIAPPPARMRATTEPAE